MPKPPQGFKLPDTGQRQDTSEEKGEDSDYTINAPNLSYNSDKMVIIDNNTQLMWQADAQAGMSMPKGHDYCTALALGDHDDWRLPTIKSCKRQPATAILTRRLIPVIFEERHQARQVSGRVREFRIVWIPGGT
jgi:hypothetical protein